MIKLEFDGKIPTVIKKQITIEEQQKMYDSAHAMLAGEMEQQIVVKGKKMIKDLLGERPVRKVIE